MKLIKERKTMDKSGWLNGINALRGIAILLVMFHHLSAYFGMSTWFGYVGVSIFMVMSGFLEGYHNLYNDNCMNGKELLFKKIKSFLPLHIIMFIMAFGLTIIEYKKNQSSNFGVIILVMLANLFFVQGFIPIRKFYFGMNGVEWYMTSYLFFIYLMPNIIKWAKKLKNEKMILILIMMLQLMFAVIIGKLKLSDNMFLWIIYVNPFIRIIDYVEGILLSKIVLDNDGKIYDLFHNKVKCSLAELIYIIVFFYVAYIGKMLPKSVATVWIYSSLSIGMVYLFALNGGGYYKNISNKIFIV